MPGGCPAPGGLTLTSAAHTRSPLRIDVSEVIGEQASLAATYYPAQTRAAGRALLVCLPGGTYSREYWDLSIPNECVGCAL